MKKAPLATTLKLAVGAALVAFLASCETYPESDSNESLQTGGIPDTDYPAMQIVGEWIFVWADNARISKNKNYIKLSPDGTGIKRVLMFRNGARLLDATSDLRWNYLGKNRWSIGTVPGSIKAQYLAPGASVGPEAAAWRTCIYRLVPPRLYDVTLNISLVPLDNEALVRALHQEYR